LYVGVRKAVYVTDADRELWERAERYAAEHRMKVSAVVLLALQRFLDADE
jgi:hypothetical protein